MDILKKILVWETLGIVSGGQKMTLAVMDMLADNYDFCCLIPTEGALSEELKKRNIKYVLLGDQTMPTGQKKKSVIFRYLFLSIKAIILGLRVVRKEKPDIIYAPGPAALPWSAIVGMLKNKPVIWHLHHVFLDGATKKLLNLCSSLKSVKRIVAVSECVGAQIYTTQGKPKIAVIYNPVDYEKYSAGKKGELLRELGITSDDKIVLGQIALLQSSKKQNMLLDIAAKLKMQGKEVVVIFVGRSRDEDAEYVKQLNETVERLDLKNRTHFLGQRDDIQNILADLNMILIPSAFEGFPLVGLEAAAAGVPVLACNIAGAEEFIRVSHAGICFENDDVESAVSAVEFLTDPKNIEECVRNGKLFAKLCSFDNYRCLIGDVFKI